MNVESIGEVKVLSSTYQAEFGRSSGVHVIAITKSGTNQFRGSLYDVERSSDWNANSKVNILNRDPKADLEGTRVGLLDWRAGRQARRQQQALLLLRSGICPTRRRRRRRRFRVPTAARAHRRLLAVTRSKRRGLPPDSRCLDGSPLHGGGHARLLPGWRRRRPHSRQSPLPDPA